MAKMNFKKIALIGGLTAGGLFLLNKLNKARAEAAELEKEIEAKAKEQAASGADKESVVATLIQHPQVQEQIAKVGTGAADFVKGLMSKLGVG